MKKEEITRLEEELRCVSVKEIAKLTKKLVKIKTENRKGGNL